MTGQPRIYYVRQSGTFWDIRMERQIQNAESTVPGVSKHYSTSVLLVKMRAGHRPSGRGAVARRPLAHDLHGEALRHRGALDDRAHDGVGLDASRPQLP